MTDETVIENDQTKGNDFDSAWKEVSGIQNKKCRRCNGDIEITQL